MKKKLTHNLGLKILSLVVAFAVWLLVVNINDPVISITYSGIGVEIVNADYLENQGKTYEVLNRTNVINVTLTGKRSIVESIRKENIKAIADIQYIGNSDSVAIQLSTNKNNSKLESLKGSRTSVKLNIEDLKTIHMPITVNVTGTPEDGYVVGEITTDQNTISVSGPESVISTIERAEASVDVSDRNSYIQTSSKILLYDADNKLIDTKKLSMNINSIGITVPILPTKSLTVSYYIKGNPADGYIVNGEPELSYSKVRVYGKQSVLDSTRAIVIPESELDITGMTEDFTKSIKINDYLPEGVKLVNPDIDKEVVTIHIEKAAHQTLEIPVDNIKVTGVPDNYDYQISLNNEDAEIVEIGEDLEVKYRLETYGISADYVGVKGDDILGTVDFGEIIGNNDIVAGVYKAEVTFELPESIKQSKTCYINIILTEKVN